MRLSRAAKAIRKLGPCLHLYVVLATYTLEGWSIPNISDTLKRKGVTKPTVFGLIDFTAGYHQTPLDKDSRAITAFICAFGLFQWTRVAMGLKGSCPFFQRSMASVVISLHNL